MTDPLLDYMTRLIAAARVRYNDCLIELGILPDPPPTEDELLDCSRYYKISPFFWLSDTMGCRLVCRNDQMDDEAILEWQEMVAEGIIDERGFYRGGTT